MIERGIANKVVARLGYPSLLMVSALACVMLMKVGLADSHKQDVSFTPAQVARIKAFGPWPSAVPADPGNELSGMPWAQRLGERLFSDPVLSGSGTIACSSCHVAQSGFADARAVAQGVARHVRNTQGLLNVGLQRWFGWDGGADSLWAASLRPMLSPIEMGADVATVARALKRTAYVTTALADAGVVSNPATLPDEALVVLAAKSVGAFMRTINSSSTAFDRYRDALLNNDKAAQQAYPLSAKRGLKLFLGEANCSVCHFGPNFSNGEFHDTGRPFFVGVGQVDPGRYSGIKRLRSDRYNLAGAFNNTQVAREIRKTTSVKSGQVNFGQWRTPSLRNLTLTGPYMHDGSLRTLHDVIDAYANIDPARLHSKGESILRPLSLSTTDKEDFVAFLRSLSVPRKH